VEGFVDAVKYLCSSDLYLWEAGTKLADAEKNLQVIAEDIELRREQDRE